MHPTVISAIIRLNKHCRGFDPHGEEDPLVEPSNNLFFLCSKYNTIIFLHVILFRFVCNTAPNWHNTLRILTFPQHNNIMFFLMF